MSAITLGVVLETSNTVALVVAEVDTRFDSHRILETGGTSKNTTRNFFVAAFVAERSNSGR